MARKSPLDTVRELLKGAASRGAFGPVGSLLAPSQGRQQLNNFINSNKFLNSPTPNPNDDPSITTRQAIGNTLQAAPRSFGNLYRNVPVVGNMFGRTAETVGSGVTDVLRSGYNLITTPNITPGSLVKNAAGGIYGAGKVVGAGLPIFQGVNAAALLPNSKVANLSAGFLEGMTGINDLAARDVAQGDKIKVNPLNLLEEDIEFDPYRLVGSMLGFTKNPINQKIFQQTETLRILGGSTKLPTKLVSFLSTNALRGGVEDFLMSLKDLPDNASTKEKVEFLRDNVLFGAASEIGGRALFSAGGRVLDTKVVSAVVDELKKAFKGSNIELPKIETPTKSGQPRDAFGQYDRVEKIFPSDLQTGRSIRETQTGGIDRRTGERVKFVGDMRQGAGVSRYGEGTQSAAGAIAGVETYQDEEGRTRFRLNPEKAALGIGIAAMGTKVFKGDGFTKAGDIGSRPPGSALPEAPRGKLEVGGGKYNTKRFNVNPELDNAIRDVAQGVEPQIATNRGGVKSLEQTMTEARTISLEDAIKGSTKETGDALVVAQSGWIKTLTEEINQLRTSAPQSPELQLKQQQLDDLIINSLSKTSTEAGRTLKAHQYLAEAMSQDAQTQLKRVVARSPERWPDAKKVVELLNKFEPNDRLGMIKFLSEIDKSTPLNKLESIWYNNILSNTSTQLANLIGNEGRHWWHLATKPFRVATDVGVSAFTGQPRQEFLKEMMPEIAGSVVGYRQGFRKALFAFKNGVRTSDLQKLNVPEKAIKGKLGSAISVPSRQLVAGDEFYRSVNETMEIYRQAASTAAKEGLKGDAYNTRMGELVASPTPEMVKNAQKLAEDLLFQNVSKELRAVGGLRDMFKFDIPKLGTVRPMRFVIPFIQVPLNVAKFGFEASPIGIGATALKAKSLPRAELNRKMASGVLGTMTTVALASLVVEDKLTGRQPKNQKEADAFYAQGKLPYSVRIGDTWVQYNRLPEPLASQLTNLAVLYDEFRDNPDASLSQKAGAYTLGMVRGLADRTFLQGIGDLMNAVEDPERYGKNFLQNIATGFIPASSLTAAAARAVDPVVRDPQNIGEAVQAKIPGLSQNVTPRDSAFEEGGVATRKTLAIQNFLPIKTSQQQDLSAKQVAQLPAKAMLKELKRFTPEQKKAILTYVKKSNPTLFYNVKKELTDKKLGTTKEEVNLRNRDVQERARTIKLELSRAESREQKLALLKDYKAKGILTDSVIAELKR